MVYYNPDDELLQDYLDVVLALDIINGYIWNNLEFPEYRISAEKEFEICYKRQGAEQLADFITEHRDEGSVLDLIEKFEYQLNCRAAKYPADSSAYRMFCCMRDGVREAGQEVGASFL